MSTHALCDRRARPDPSTAARGGPLAGRPGSAGSWFVPSPSDATAGVSNTPLSANSVDAFRVLAACQAFGGLGMSQEPFHLPVMLDEVLELLAPVPAGLVLDATLGGAGHVAALLDARPDVVLLGCDQDPEAVAAGRARLERFGERADVVNQRFDRLGEALEASRFAEIPVVAVLFDLGVSSHQLNVAARGFSYRHEAPLDMRMDPRHGRSAADLVNTMEPAELARLFARHGEERFARQIVRAIVSHRPITTTTELAALVAATVPPSARRRGHPAARVFQALRVEVNEELAILPGALDAAIDLLAPGGRIVVLAYHSGEDRIVKQRLSLAATGGCRCPAGLPCVCGARAKVVLLHRGARRPSPMEVAENPRASAARLRAAERRSFDRGVEGPEASAS